MAEKTYPMTLEEKEKLEKELKSKIQDILAIPIQKNNPIWNINIHIIGEVSAINIERSNKNRNKYSHYINYCQVV